jgi:hypothetical protein
VLKRQRVPAAVLLAATLLLAAPALAAPGSDGGPAIQLRALLADWWGDVTAPLAALFGLNGNTVDPNGQPSSTSGESTEVLDPDGRPAAQSGDDPTASPQSRETLDPDG